MIRESTMRSPRSFGRVILCLFLVGLASSVSLVPALAVPDWMSRPGTIRNAVSLEDEAHVYLDAVIVDKISATGGNPYFVVREWYSPSDRLVVLAEIPDELRLGQTIDVEGTMTTLPGGNRAVESVTIYAYADSNGSLLTHTAVMKGTLQPIDWQWKTDITVVATETSGRNLSSRTTMDSNDTPLDLDPTPGVAYYPTIGEMLDADPPLDDGTMVGFECKPITSVGTDETYGNYFVMADDGMPPQPSIRVYYTPAQGVGDRVKRIVGKLSTQGTERVLCIDGGPRYPVATYFTGNVNIAPKGTIAWAKMFPDGTPLPVPLSGKVLTVGGGTFSGAIYIEEPDRSSGIKVAGSLLSPDLWRVVSVDGTISTLLTGERFITNASTAPSQDSLVLSPIFLSNRDVGGAVTQSGGGVAMVGNAGVENTGLLVRTSGEITYVGDTFMYIDDGAALDDGSGHTGLRVETEQLDQGNILTFPTTVGETVFVTGISSCTIVDGQVERVLRPRSQSDIDNRGPSVTISRAADQPDPTNSSPINFGVQFSDDVSDFDNSDVTIGGTAGGTKTAAVTGSGKTYSVAVAGMQSSGTVSISVAEGVAHNAAGNGNQASTSTNNDVMFDIDPPTLTVSTVEPSAAKYGTSVTITVHANEELTGNPSVVVNSRAAMFSGQSGSDCSYTFTPASLDAGGNATIAVAGTDTAGNNGTGSSTALQIVPPPMATLTGRYSDGTVRLSWSYNPYSMPFDHMDVRLVGSQLSCNVIPIRSASATDYRVWSVVGQVSLEVIAYDSPSDIVGYQAQTPLTVPTVLFGAAPTYQYTPYLTEDQMGGIYAPAY